MHSSGFGGTGMPGNLDALTRQYWQAWGDAMRNATPSAVPASTQPWQQAMDWWSQLARGAGRAQAGNDALERFKTQAQMWLGQMQQLATHFSGRDSSAGDIVGTWRRMIEGEGANPFASMLTGMRGPGLEGFEQWMQQVKPWLETLRTQAMSGLQMPAFGLNREQQERWQKLLAAQADFQKQTDAYNQLMMKATRDALDEFENLLAEREEPGRQIKSARALFDLWIDAAEAAYAKIALSTEFREIYARLVDAQMRLRGAVQREVEQSCGLFGMPTRSELDGTHRKIVELERQVRRMRDGAAPATPARGNGKPTDVQTSKPVARKKAKPARKKAAPKPAAKKAAAKPAAKKASAKPASTKAKRGSAARTAKASKQGSRLVLPAIATPTAPVSGARKR